MAVMAEKVDIFMAFYPADYLADTMDLSTEEHGAYLLLLLALWRNKGRIDATPARLASTTKVNAKRWPEVWAALARFFDCEDGKLSQGRVLEEIEKATNRKAAARANGKLGGLAKARVARNSPEVRQESATSKPLANGVAEMVADPASSPSPSPDPTPPARDLAGTEHGNQHVTGSFLTQLFGRVRSELWSDVLPWSGTPSSPEKAANMAGTIPLADGPMVEKTMRLLLTRAKAGDHRQGARIVESPAFGFACWCQEYHELREELLGKAPKKVVNGSGGAGHRRDQRFGYGEPPPAGTVYPSGTVDLYTGKVTPR